MRSTEFKNMLRKKHQIRSSLQINKNWAEKSIIGVLEPILVQKLQTKTIIFGLHVKFPKKISSNIHEKRLKQRFFRFLAISMRINNFIFFPNDDKLFSIWTLIKMKKKFENRFFFRVDFPTECLLRYHTVSPTGILRTPSGMGHY